MVLLEVNNLRVYFYEGFNFFRAVDGVSFSIQEGEFFALIGESGSGKTTTALSILGLIDLLPGIVQGSIKFKGKDLLQDIAEHCKVEWQDGHVVSVIKDRKWHDKRHQEIKNIRGKGISMIFQEPVSSLDPYFTVGEQLEEVLNLWNNYDHPKIAKEVALEWLNKVAISDPRKVYDCYPAEMSGGMCQRIMIALALCSNPDLLIADEPTTALDVTTQKEILLLLESLRDTLNLTILFITHDMDLVKSLADKIAVFYRGRILESGQAEELFGQFQSQLHPFTENLMQPYKTLKGTNGAYLTQSSYVATKYIPDQGCVYYGECLPRLKKCQDEQPPKIFIPPSHRLYCWLYKESENT